MYKLNVSDTVEFPVTLTVNDAGTPREFTLRLQAKRLTDQALDAARDSNLKTEAFLAEHITGWRDQTLVVQADGSPADYTPEAFAVLLGVGGARLAVLAAYQRALAGADGLGGRAKN